MNTLQPKSLSITKGEPSLRLRISPEMINCSPRGPKMGGIHCFDDFNFDSGYCCLGGLASFAKRISSNSVGKGTDFGGCRKQHQFHKLVLMWGAFWRRFFVLPQLLRNVRAPLLSSICFSLSFSFSSLSISFSSLLFPYRSLYI